MAEAWPAGRRKKTAAERRQQRLRAEARGVQHLLRAFEALQTHRGCAASALGRALGSALLDMRAPRAAAQTTADADPDGCMADPASDVTGPTPVSASSAARNQAESDQGKYGVSAMLISVVATFSNGQQPLAVNCDGQELAGMPAERLTAIAEDELAENVLVCLVVEPTRQAPKVLGNSKGRGTAPSRAATCGGQHLTRQEHPTIAPLDEALRSRDEGEYFDFINLLFVTLEIQADTTYLQAEQLLGSCWQWAATSNATKQRVFDKFVKGLSDDPLKVLDFMDQG